MSANDTRATAKPPIRTGTISAVGDPRDRECRQTLRKRTQEPTRRRASARSNAPTIAVAPTTAIRMPGTRLLFLSSRITANVPAPTANAVQFALPSRIASAMAHRFSQRSVALDREAEKLGQLADQHRQRDSVHVAIADWLGEKLGYEAQPRHACQNANDPRDDRHHAGEGDGAHAGLRRTAEGRRRG